jgi:uncharacterized protein
MRGSQSLILSGLILRRIFDRNQEEFTQAEPKTIPTIAVVEEAQSVLNEKATAAEPYIAWVKEGRKYDLGSLLITQQPGSIPVDILSQGDNWFIFHLLSASDLTTLQRANAHFSGDILSVLLNEPIPGQGIFWSSVGGKPYPVSIRAYSFEHMYKALDPTYERSAITTFAQQMKEQFQQALDKGLQTAIIPRHEENLPDDRTSLEIEEVDTMAVYKLQAIESLKQDTSFLSDVARGTPWGKIGEHIREKFPDIIELRERDKIAFKVVREVLLSIFGDEDEGWHTFKTRTGTTMVKSGKNVQGQRV